MDYGFKSSTSWNLASDASLHIGRVDGTDTCLSAVSLYDIQTPELKPCIYTGPLPPPLLSTPSFAEKAFVWGPTTRQIVSAASSTCLTAGLYLFALRRTESVQ